jgi:hypothetical protein
MHPGEFVSEMVFLYRACVYMIVSKNSLRTIHVTTTLLALSNTRR